MNSAEYPVQAPVLPDDSETDEKKAEKAERIMLARNFAQVYFADLDYRNRHLSEKVVPELERDKTVEKYGQEFEQWYESAEGMAALTSYVKNHNIKSIIQKKDMDDLVRSFLAFKNRPSR